MSPLVSVDPIVDPMAPIAPGTADLLGLDPVAAGAAVAAAVGLTPAMLAAVL